MVFSVDIELKKIYYATKLFSTSCITYLIVNIMIFVIPLIIMNNSNELWIKNQTYFSQP